MGFPDGGYQSLCGCDEIAEFLTSSGVYRQVEHGRRCSGRQHCRRPADPLRVVRLSPGLLAVMALDQLAS